MSNKKKYALLIAILAILILGIITVNLGPKIYRELLISSAIKEMEKKCENGKPDNPENGGIVECLNGEWIVIDLHHGSMGFTLAYTSDSEAFVETDYHPHPVIECWWEIIYGKDRKGYLSIDDFFNKNMSIVWKRIK